MFVSAKFKLGFENKQDKEKVLVLMHLQNPSVSDSYQKAWQVLKSALALPLLKRSLTRDFSPFKAVLIQGKWQRQTSRLVPSNFGGTLRNTG